MTRPESAIAHPPETVEGWYVLHQIFSPDRAALRVLSPAALAEAKQGAVLALSELACPGEGGGGWTAVAPLVGSDGGVLLVHFRATLDDLGVVERRVLREPLFDAMRPVRSFLSVTEAGLYHVTAQLAREAEERGGAVGDASYQAAVAERVSAERTSAHARRRLYPELPLDMPYICFYPMSKKREPGANWYTLSLAERSRLMQAHGATGRRYAGRVVQVIAGAIGLDDWEWGVTLFARDPLEFKKLVTEMRFDEVSAKYAEFGEFYVGKVVDAGAWVAAF